MDLLDLLLNLVGLLLLLGWRSLGSRASLRETTTASLFVPVRSRIQGPHRWLFLLWLVGLLAGRAILYWHLGASWEWTAHLSLGIISIPFRPDLLSRMFLYSALSFGQFYLVYHLSLGLLVLIHRSKRTDEPLHRWVTVQLGRVAHLPGWLLFFHPFLLVGLTWLWLAPTLSAMDLAPGTLTGRELFRQCIVVGAAGFIFWKHLLVGLLLLHLINNYIYLGNFAVWNYINLTAQRLLRPIQWIPLSIGKLDFRPFVGIVIILLVSQFLTRRLGDLLVRWGY